MENSKMAMLHKDVVRARALEVELLELKEEEAIYWVDSRILALQIREKVKETFREFEEFLYFS